MYYLGNEYINVPRPMIVEKIKDNQEHSQTMIELTSLLSYLEFDDAKECSTSKKMWDKLENINGGDKNVLRDKA